MKKTAAHTIGRVTILFRIIFYHRKQMTDRLVYGADGTEIILKKTKSGIFSDAKKKYRFCT